MQLEKNDVRRPIVREIKNITNRENSGLFFSVEMSSQVMLCICGFQINFNKWERADI